MSLLLAGGQTFNDSVAETTAIADLLVGGSVFLGLIADTLTTDDAYTVPIFHQVDWSLRPIIRDYWDRDEWGRFYPGAGTHRG